MVNRKKMHDFRQHKIFMPWSVAASIMLIVNNSSAIIDPAPPQNINTPII